MYKFNSHEELFNQLTRLVKTNEAFYITEQVFDDTKYQIFNYRLCSYSDWSAPGAFNARGTMFQVDDSGNFVRLACLPFSKFFGYNENPFTMNLDLSDVDYIADKADGSLISSWLDHNDKLRLKTKGSLFSEQTVASTQLLNTSYYSELLYRMEILTIQGYTINAEYCAPSNRIVLSYNKPELRVLSVRNNSTGDYLPFTETKTIFGKYMVDDYTDIAREQGFENYITNITDREDNIEGIVVRLNNGTMFKVKTAKYVNLHRTKDSIIHPRRLFEAVLSGGSDDLRSLFANDPWVLNRIDLMEDHVFKHYNHIVATVESLYEMNKELSRKDFAISMQQLVPKHVFALLMNKYIGRENDYKEYFVINYDLYKLPDEILPDILEEVA